MFCPKCGAPLQENARFCPACGEAAPEAAAEKKPETPAPETAAPEAPAPETAAPEAQHQAFFPDEAPVKKKKKVWPWVAGVLAAAIAAFGVVVALNFDYFSNLARKTFTSDESYYRHVEEKAAGSDVERVANAYDRLLSAMPKEASGASQSTVSLAIDLPDEGKALLKTVLGDDLSWLDDLSVDLSVRSDPAKGLSDSSLSLSLNGTAIPILSAVPDPNGSFLVKIPLLSDQAIRLSADDLSERSGALSGLSLPGFDELKKIFPDGGSLGEFLQRYLTAAREAVEEVESASETGRAGEKEFEFTVLTYTLDSAAFEKIGKALVETAKEDDQAKALYEALVVPRYRAVQEAVGEGIEVKIPSFGEFLDGLLEKDEDEDGDSEAIRIRVYVDAYGAICGRSVRIGEEGFSYFSVKTGDERDGSFEITFEKDAEDGKKASKTLTAEYSFTEKDGLCTGKATLTSDGEALLTFETEEFGLNEEKKLVGKISLVPSEEILKKLTDGNALIATLLKNVSITADLNGSPKASVKINNASVVTFALSSKREALKEAIPAADGNGKTISEWARSIAPITAALNVQKTLKEAGVPSSILSRLLSLASQYLSSLLPSAS